MKISYSFQIQILVCPCEGNIDLYRDQNNSTFKIYITGTSLAIQWLKLHTADAGSVAFDPWGN